MEKPNLKYFRILFTLTFILFIVGSVNLSAANYITVATIGAAPSPDKNQEPQKIVNQVIAFWQRELDQVLPDKPDLVVLPEVCDMSGAGDEYLHIRKNQVLDYFASVAKNNRCYIAFGMLREDTDGAWYNSCVLLDRDGRIAGIYNKNFPTIGEMEKGIRPGMKSPVFQCDFGRVVMAICFDLNFDELREKYAAEKPDLIIFSSVYHGGLAQGAWAYRCRSYFVGSVYKGTPSEVRNPMGGVVASSTNYFDFAVARINLDCKLVHLDYNWSKLTALKEKYGESVTITDPGKLGSVLIASEDKNVSAGQMIKEFNIELLDDYLNRVRSFRLKGRN